MKKTKKAQPIYLTEDQRRFVEDAANFEAVTMNAYIVSLINKEMKKRR